MGGQLGARTQKGALGDVTYQLRALFEVSDELVELDLLPKNLPRPGTSRCIEILNWPRSVTISENYHKNKEHN